MQSKAATVTEYLAGLPADRRKAIEAVAKTSVNKFIIMYEESRKR